MIKAGSQPRTPSSEEAPLSKATTRKPCPEGQFPPRHLQGCFGNPRHSAQRQGLPTWCPSAPSLPRSLPTAWSRLSAAGQVLLGLVCWPHAGRGSQPPSLNASPHGGPFPAPGHPQGRRSSDLPLHRRVAPASGAPLPSQAVPTPETSGNTCRQQGSPHHLQRHLTPPPPSPQLSSGHLWPLPCAPPVLSTPCPSHLCAFIPAPAPASNAPQAPPPQPPLCPDHFYLQGSATRRGSGRRDAPGQMSGPTDTRQCGAGPRKASPRKRATRELISRWENLVTRGLSSRSVPAPALLASSRAPLTLEITE